MSPSHAIPPTVPLRSSSRPALGEVVSRSVVVSVVGLAVALIVDRIEPTEDANIGAGLLGLAAMLLVTTGWAVVDGRRHSGARPYLLWLAVSVTAAVLTALGAGGFAALALGTSPDELAGFLIMSVTAASGSIPFVLAPAAVGVAIGQLLARVGQRERP